MKKKINRNLSKLLFVNKPESKTRQKQRFYLLRTLKINNLKLTERERDGVSKSENESFGTWTT